MLCDWAKLPISDDEFLDKIRALQARYFPTTQLLPGVEDMLQRLRKTGVQMALATSSTTRNFNLKTAHLGHVFEKFDPALVVRGDDPRLPKGRGKPAPDIFLLALQTINDSLAASGKPEIHPEECLVFEDSVPGVEAGRRAGMQVVWCPHEGLMGVYQDRKAEVLAGSTGQHKDDGSNDDAAWERKRDEWVGQGREHARVRGRIGEIDDGWAILYNSLENFSLDFYGIV
jgi:pseudouridine-5'-monophosphatase